MARRKVSDAKLKKFQKAATLVAAVVMTREALFIAGLRVNAAADGLVGSAGRVYRPS
jgi:hypothetical protein